MKLKQVVGGGSAVRLLGTTGCSAAILILGGCLATTPGSGGGSATAAQGAAAGASAQGENSSLEKCPETLGTIRIEENTNASWYSYYNSRYRTGSTVPVLRMMVQQSNCFVVVERSQRGQANMAAERALIRGDEGRAGSNMGGGQMVAADYSMAPEIMLSDQGGTQARGVAGGLGRMLGGLGGMALGAVGGSISSNEAGTVLLLVDVRSGVQISAAEGYARNTDFGVFGSIFGGGGAAAASAFTRTPEGKVILAAFVDSYNKMVVALRSYKAQTVKGGLGTGGRLGVQGGSTPASKEINQKQ
jgi:curli biogenesis system outer membrane secretion channel CsgG